MKAEHVVSRCAEKAMELHHLTPRDLARAIGCGEGSIYNLLNERPVQYFLYWAGIACALAGLYLSIEILVKEKVKRNRVSEILMTVFCIAAMMIWGVVIYLAVSQLVTWGQCL